MKRYGLWSFSFIGLWLITIPYAISAPCCGGGQGQNALITGDERATFFTHYMFSQVVIDALGDGQYLSRANGQEEFQHTLAFEGSYVVTDRWQIGARLPIVYRYVAYDQKPRNLGFGDGQLHVGWEALTEARYSIWKPKLYLFSQVSFPLSDSPWESSRPASSMSRGFWNLGLGILGIKRWSDWDASLSFELHHGLPRNVRTGFDSSRTHVDPGVGTSFGLAAGYRWRNGLRLGLTESYAYESGISFESSSGVPDAPSQYYWATSFQLGYSINDHWTMTGTYTDQTLLGAARNVALNRIFAVSVQTSWDR